MSKFTPKYWIGDTVMFKTSFNNPTLAEFSGKTGEVIDITTINNGVVYQLKDYEGWFTENCFVGRYEAE